jgi:hypothetical protein
MCRSVPQTPQTPQAPILMSAALLEIFGHGTVWITGTGEGGDANLLHRTTLAH